MNIDAVTDLAIGSIELCANHLMLRVRNCVFGPYFFWGMKKKHFVNSRVGLVGYDTTSCGGGAPTCRRNVTASIAKVVVAPYHIYVQIVKMHRWR